MSNPNEATRTTEMCLVDKIFRLAERYREASDLLNDQSRRDQTQVENYGCSGPHLLVDSFSIELYLKCLYVLDTGRSKVRGHNWEELYEELNQGTKDALRVEYHRFIDEDPIVGNFLILREINPDGLKVRDFKRALKAARLTFTDRRYLYEPPDPNKPKEEWYYADFLGKAIRSVLVKDPRISCFVND